VTNTLALYDEEFIGTVKRYIVLAPRKKILILDVKEGPHDIQQNYTQHNGTQKGKQ
jgi:hypothetical protein